MKIILKKIRWHPNFFLYSIFYLEPQISFHCISNRYSSMNMYWITNSHGKIVLIGRQAFSSLQTFNLRTRWTVQKCSDRFGLYSSIDLVLCWYIGWCVPETDSDKSKVLLREATNKVISGPSFLLVVWPLKKAQFFCGLPNKDYIAILFMYYTITKTSSWSR